MKRWQIIFLLLLVAGTAFILRRNVESKIPFQRVEGMIFGTVYHATYQCRENLDAQILSELQAVDASLSMFNPGSCVSRLNKGEATITDTLLQTVFAIAQEVSRQTDGAFDVTVAPLVNAWGFGFKHESMPTAEHVDSLLATVGYQKVSLSGDTLRKPAETILDFSAVAKGFASDQVGRMFKRNGVQNYMIEIGGEVVCSGRNPNGGPWRIGINQPTEDNTDSGELQTVLSLNESALATSGNYRNFYEKDGRKYAHTIDPKSGYPVQHSLLSSTVLAPSCAVADAYATAFMVMGVERAQQLLSKHPELKAFFIFTDANGKLTTWSSPELELEK